MNQENSNLGINKDNFINEEHANNGMSQDILNDNTEEISLPPFSGPRARTSILPLAAYAGSSPFIPITPKLSPLHIGMQGSLGLSLHW